MNLTMQPPMSYPFYMESSRLRFPLPWSPNPYQYSSYAQQYYSSAYRSSPSLTPTSYPLPFILSRQPRPNLPSKSTNSFSSYTNTRYNHLKQATSQMNRHRSIETTLQSQRYSVPHYHHYQPSHAKSVPHFYQNSTNLLKAHSWHSMNHLNQSNLNINYTNDMYVVHKNNSHHANSPKQKKKIHKRHLSLSPKQNIPSQGVVRISTLDQMPVINNPIYNEATVITTKSKNVKQQSPPSSTSSSHSSLQKRLNGSLRHDPLLTAAMEDFRQLQRASSQSTLLTHHRDISRDSLCSDSRNQSSTSSSPTSLSSSSSSSSSSLTSPSPISRTSRNHSHSSFTSLERLEIRRLMKTLRTNGLQSLSIPAECSSHMSPVNAPIIIDKTSSTSPQKPFKSSITEELDEVFNKLRANNPNQELIFVKPSTISKEKKLDTPLSTSDKISTKKPRKKGDTSKLQHTKEKSNENPTLCVPIAEKTIESKPEYATPLKKASEINLRSPKKDEHPRSFSFCKPINDIDNEIRQTRPASMFNWLNYGLTNPFPSTLQPNGNLSVNSNNDNQHDKSLVKENIYASEIDVHIPLSDDKDYFHNQTSTTDYLPDCKQQTTNSSSILNDFSRLFTRFGNNKHEHKSKLKKKLHKNNNNHHHNLRCSLM